MAVRTAQAGLQTTGGVASSTYANSVSGGCIGYITRTSNAGPVSGSASDVGGMSFSFTANSSRLIKLEFWCSGVSTTDSTTYGTIAIQEGSNILAQGRCGPASVVGISGPAPIYVPYLWRGPTATSHTIKVTLARVAGSGSLTIAGGADNEMFLAAYDMGPNF